MQCTLYYALKGDMKSSETGVRKLDEKVAGENFAKSCFKNADPSTCCLKADLPSPSSPQHGPIIVTVKQVHGVSMNTHIELASCTMFHNPVRFRVTSSRIPMKLFRLNFFFSQKGSTCWA